MKKITILTFVSVILILFTNCNDSSHYKNQKPIEINTNTSRPVFSINDGKTRGKSLNVAISTMISPKKTFYLYENLLRYIEGKVGIPIKLKQRKTYKEVNDLLEEGKLDFAYVCSGAYVVAKRKFPLKILAVPVIDGKTYYQAYIIVSKSSGITKFEELRDKSFAFSDPLSNTGYKYVVKILKDIGTKPDDYFSKTIFTFAHDYSIQAVARGLVDGATVDGLVYDFLKINNPKRVKDVKIIRKSPDFGIPPFVYAPSTNPDLIRKIQNILIGMDKDKKGKKILNKLQIEKFVKVDPDIYNSIQSFN
ncbi:ABC transporter, substrate-binding protein (cluster 12, methionine/phosphonates) [hydrothermal vent metagenome]|uniref:ABC transporter, substrate-binding protein (Cluster 12, methionine/phosphonates) n=1 Tax=hydrothermal vent metagenome TaxID=652676 RepID=A0A3B1CVW6_9ZZZZ